ncbi:MAG: FAD-dependent oxidoreductase [Bacillota bacterium]|nr:FAD-dependent oxidoreductase [Bacillota bacterium]
MQTTQQTITQAVEAKIAGQWDILVCGGGTAGCIAALAAARNGASVALIEKSFFLGGMMSEGNAGLTKYIIHARTPEEQTEIVEQLKDNPAKVQLAGGIPMEVTHKLLTRKAAIGTYGTGASYVYTDSQEFKIMLYEMMQEAGVTVIFHAFACSVLTENTRISGIVAETKGGRMAFMAGQIIDATGDGDVAALAGVPFHLGVSENDAVYKQGLAELGTLQNVGSMFRIGGVDFNRYVDYLRDHPEAYAVQRFGLMTYDAFIKAYDAGEMIIGIGITPSGRKFQIYNYPYPGIMIGCISVKGNRDGTDIYELSRAEYDIMIEARNQVMALRDLPGFEQAFVLDTPQAGIRETRHVQGEYSLNVMDIVTGRVFPDGIGKGCHPVDIGPLPREVEENPIGEGWHYNIPYRCLVAVKYDNLLLAGRNTSATREAAGCLRTTVACMVMGQAAGTAAALLSQNSRAARDIDINHLRRILQEQGAVI